MPGARVAALTAAAGLSLVCAGLSVQGQTPASSVAEPALVFVAPQDGSFISGPTTMQVRVEPEGTPVKNVSLFADGRLLSVVERPPFEATWDAGPKVVEHLLRAVAVLADGRRIARSIRTEGVAYTESVDVDVVQITASVTDGRGNFVRGLQRQAFRVEEDRVRQEIRHFKAENIPLEIIVAVDVSGSMTDSMAQVKRAVKTFLSALRPQDRVTLVGFNDNVFTLARPSADLAARLKAVDRLAPWGGTALYDVILQSLDQLGRQPGRRVLVVFTDGEDLNSHVPLDLAEKKLEASDAVLYAVAHGRGRQLDDLKRVLQRLTEKSGGRPFFGDLGKLDEVFANILEELSNQYLLGYVPTTLARDGQWRAVSVRVPGTDYRIRARQGYRAVAR